MTATSLYETDFYGWTRQQADLIRTGTSYLLDFDNILEEIEAMERAEKRSLRSRLSVLLMHLIQWQFQPERRSKSWEFTIINQRMDIADLLQDSPGLKNMPNEMLLSAWNNAMRRAEAETGIEKSHFPEECPWTFEECMAEDFWPEMPEDNAR